MSSFPFKTYYFATISDHLGKHKNIFRELKTDQDRLKSDRHGGPGKAKECERWIEVGQGVKKSRRFFVSKLPGDNTDLRGRIHSLASLPLCRVLPRIGMILVWKIKSSSTCLVFWFCSTETLSSKHSLSLSNHLAQFCASAEIVLYNEDAVFPLFVVT